MRILTLISGATLAILLAATPAVAQEQIADRSTLHTAMAAASAVDQTNRQIVMKALQAPDVRELAGRLGVDLVEAERAMATMTSAELEELARPARAIVDRAGGDRMITISLTTLLLGIILILLIAD